MSGGVLVRVVFVQMVFVRGGFCPTPISFKGAIRIQMQMFRVYIKIWVTYI